MKIVANLFGISFLFLAFGCGGAASTTKAEAPTPATAKSEKPCEGKKKSSAAKPCDKGAKADAEKPCDKSKGEKSEKQASGDGDTKVAEKPCTKDKDNKPCCGEGEDCCSKEKKAGKAEAPCDSEKEKAHSHEGGHNHGDGHSHSHQ